MRDAILERYFEQISDDVVSQYSRPQWNDYAAELAARGYSQITGKEMEQHLIYLGLTSCDCCEQYAMNPTWDILCPFCRKEEY